MGERTYSPTELTALRCVDRHEWNRSGDPSERGPAQYAAGGWWPKELRKIALRLEDRARKYRIAADAMEREGNRAD